MARVGFALPAKKASNTGDITANFGMITTGGTYMLHVPFPPKWIATDEEEDDDDDDLHSMGLHIVLRNDDRSIQIVWHATTEGKFQHTQSLGGEPPVHLVVRGTVMNPNRGKPSLRAGVKCITKPSAQADTSEATDWTGFDGI